MPYHHLISMASLKIHSQISLPKQEMATLKHRMKCFTYRNLCVLFIFSSTSVPVLCMRQYMQPSLKQKGICLHLFYISLFGEVESLKALGSSEIQHSQVSETIYNEPQYNCTPQAASTATDVLYIQIPALSTLLPLTCTGNQINAILRNVFEIWSTTCNQEEAKLKLPEA